MINSQPTPRGLTILLTGDGKGKTTAALGMLLRAHGQGMKVGALQFSKTPRQIYGEALACMRLNIHYQSLGSRFTWDKAKQEKSRKVALLAWLEAQNWIKEKQYDMLLLDEMTYLFDYNWLDAEDTAAWLGRNKPPATHLIITGRRAPEELIEFADLVTEMKEVKHPFREQGLLAQVGIEY
jgi:cob(I)alamin adenosyltransferase